MFSAVADADLFGIEALPAKQKESHAPSTANAFDPGSTEGSAKPSPTALTDQVAKPDPKTSTSRPWNFGLRFPKIGCCSRCPCEQYCCPCSCCRALKWVCLIIFLFIVAVGITVLVLWKVLKPKFPSYNVENVQFSYNVSASSGPTSYILNTETLFTMVLSNPNTKIGILYDEIALGLQLFGLDIGDQVFLGVFDGCGVTQYLPGNLTSGDIPLDADVQALLTDAVSANDVPLNLDIIVKLQAKVGLVLTPPVQITLLCLLDINPSAGSGSQVENMSCKFKLKLPG